MESGKDVVFILTKEDVVNCATEMDIPEEAITDEVIADVKKAVAWGMEDWPVVVREAISMALKS